MKYTTVKEMLIMSNCTKTLSKIHGRSYCPFTKDVPEMSAFMLSCDISEPSANDAEGSKLSQKKIIIHLV